MAARRKKFFKPGGTGKKTRASIKTLQKNLSVLNTRLKEAGEKYRASKITEEEYKKIVGNLRPQIAGLEGKLQKLSGY